MAGSWRERPVHRPPDAGSSCSRHSPVRCSRCPCCSAIERSSRNTTPPRSEQSSTPQRSSAPPSNPGRPRSRSRTTAASRCSPRCRRSSSRTRRSHGSDSGPRTVPCCSQATRPSRPAATARTPRSGMPRVAPSRVGWRWSRSSTPSADNGDRPATPLFQTFAPLRISGSTDVVGAVEIEQFVAALEERADDPWWLVQAGAAGITVLLALLALISVARGMRRAAGTRSKPGHGRLAGCAGRVAIGDGRTRIPPRSGNGSSGRPRGPRRPRRPRSRSPRVSNMCRADWRRSSASPSDERVEELKEGPPPLGSGARDVACRTARVNAGGRGPGAPSAAARVPGARESLRGARGRGRGPQRGAGAAVHGGASGR